MSDTGSGQVAHQLPEAHREVLELLALGTAPADIADQLGVPEQAVAPLIEVARAKLRSQIRARSDGGGASGL